MAKKKWMQSAVKRPGALTRRAKRNDRSVRAQAEYDKTHGDTREKRQANLYFTFMKANKKKKSKRSLMK